MDSICNEVVWGRGGMADTLVLGTSASACGFESHRPHSVGSGIPLTQPGGYINHLARFMNNFNCTNLCLGLSKSCLEITLNTLIMG